MPAIMRDWGIRSAIASPIVVEGELWGAIVVVSLGLIGTLLGSALTSDSSLVTSSGCAN